MPKELEILFDPEEDGKEKPTLLGTFPAHIVGYLEGTANNASIPYNVKFKIAPEAKEMKGINWKDKTEKDPEGVEVPADYMVGREVRSVGIWLNPDPKPTDRWKNRDYVNFLEAIGIELKTVEKDGKKFQSLVTLEEHEVIGRPCMITVKLENDKRPEMSGRQYPKAFSFQVWDGGERIDVTEDEEDVFAT
jgi:hypothetical protein